MQFCSPTVSGELSAERGPASHRRAGCIDALSDKAPTTAGWSVAPQTSRKYLVLKTLSSSGKKNHLDKMLFLLVREGGPRSSVRINAFLFFKEN